MLLARIDNLRFLLDGHLTAHCSRFPDRQVGPGQMFRVSCNAIFSAEVFPSCKILLFCFGIIKNPCDISMLQSYYDCHKHITYQFEPVAIRYPLPAFIKLLVHCRWNGMNCGHFHAIKHRELFLYLRCIYTREEVVRLWRVEPLKQHIYRRAATPEVSVKELIGEFDFKWNIFFINIWTAFF